MVAINLVGWPRGVLPMELLTEVLRGGLAVAREAGCPVIGGHCDRRSGTQVRHGRDRVADPDRLLRNDAAAAGLPLTLTKPLGVGLLNNRHKQTGEVFAEAVATMTAAQPWRAGAGAGRRGARRRPTSPGSACSDTCTRWRGRRGSAR